MKYIFFGTPRFAKIVLENLIKADLKPIAVVCNPDRPVGKKQITTPPPAKVLAQENQIDVYQPESLDNFTETLEKLNLEYSLVAAYAKILPKKIVELPKKGTLGVHPSLLPKYRGATPIQSALLAGEEKTGTSIYQMDEKMDHGPILAQKNIPIAPDETYLSLEKKLAILGANLVIENNFTSQKQDHSQAIFTKKFKTQDAEVNLKTDSSIDIYHKIQALNPEPGVYTFSLENHKGKRVKLLKARLENKNLRLLEIQVEGKTPKTVDIFIKEN